MSIHSIKDEQLVSSYINGSNHALSSLIKRHRIKILSFIISKVRDKSLAEDIFQDTFIKVIKTLKKGNYNEQGKFLPWVMRIAYNLCIDYFRKKKKITLIRSNDNFNIFDVIKDKSSSVEDQIIQKRIINDLKNIINELPMEQREVLKMRYYSDMSFQEIANDCGISINTALGRMRYALINIRKLVNKKGILLSAD